VCKNILPVRASVNREEQKLGREKGKVMMQDGKRINEEKEGKQGDRNDL